MRRAFSPMSTRTMTLAALSALAIHLVACDRKPDEPDARPSEPVPALPVAPGPTASAAASGPAPVAPLDTAALSDRRNPERLLRFYASALHQRDWASAARAWGKGSGVTAKTLEAAYNRPERPTLEVGKGSGDAGAGSQFYEASVTLRFGSEAPERGTLYLRRVNDVDGATPEQLDWRIERSTIGAGQ